MVNPLTGRPVLLFCSPEDPPDLWQAALAREMPDLEVRLWPEAGALEEIDHALVYKPPHGMLATLPNLRAIFSIAAGVDAIVADPDLPDVPLVRMVDDNLRDMMSEYAIYAVLHFHREMPRFFAQMPHAEWNRGWPAYTADTAVGVLGLGAIGQDVAAKLGALGFAMHGWSRSPRTVAGVTCHHGDAGLLAMAAQVRYLVCVLPLTGETRGIIGRDLLAALPRGACVINIGRGGHVDDAALLAALEDGRVAGAFLDVFNTEPLPADHPYWAHPKVWITPHIAGELVPRSCARSVVANIRRLEAGEALPHTYDFDRGY